MQNNVQIHGRYTFIARDARTGRELWRKRLENQLMTVNQIVRDQMLLGTFAGPDDVLQIKYLAFGTGTTPAAASDTALETEVFRKQVTQQSYPSTGTVRTIVALTDTEANFTIREIGVFAGPDASSTAGSGTLLSRVNVSIEKNAFMRLVPLFIKNIILDIIRQDVCTIDGENPTTPPAVTQDPITGVLTIS